MDDALVTALLRDAIPAVIVIYRFGSTVTGKQRPDSDVDLAVLAASALDPVRRFELQEQLAVTLRRDVDLVDLRRASTVMAMQVVSTGTVLASFDRREQERFEDYVFGSYARLNEERRAILQQVLHEGSVHGR